MKNMGFNSLVRLALRMMSIGILDARENFCDFIQQTRDED